MNVLRDQNLYKASRITGPSHNFLGLELCDQSELHFEVEALPSLDQSSGLDEKEVVSAVCTGVSEGNRSYGTTFSLKKLQYLPSDTPDASVYVELAKAIVEAARNDLAST